MDKKNQVLMSVLGVFALVIVTVGVSYAFFTYSRTGTTTSTITSGDISFTYLEGASATLENAFPVSDTYGAQDNTGAYKFSVNTTYSGPAEMKYDVYLVDANEAGTVEVKEYTFTEGGIVEKEEDGTPKYELKTVDAKFFGHDQIKFNLLSTDSTGANETAVTTNLAKTGATNLGTTSTGVLVSEYLSTGVTEGKVINAKPITNGTTDYYTLRLWLNDDNTTDTNVDYSNTALTDDYTDENNDAQVSVSKFGGYTYSLKVKVTANATNTYGTVTE